MVGLYPIYTHLHNAEQESRISFYLLVRLQTGPSEVATMIEGVLRHCTDMTVEKQYVDSQGQSEVAFALCRLLGFELLPRLKAMASQKRYRPVAGRPEDFSNLQPILTRPIHWELIRQ